MSKITAFVQVQGKPGIAEVEIAIPATVDHIHRVLADAGIELDKDTAVFIEESEEAVGREHGDPAETLKAGCRIHVTRCRKIKVTVHFQDKTIERAFGPGVRVRTVKKWAVRELNLNPTDAGEHVLQLCGSVVQPPTDTPLAELTDGHSCAVCFDLVPEKRIEG